MEVWETGLPSYWVKNAMPPAQKCFAQSKPLTSSRQIPIRLNDLEGAFLILGIGFGLATFIFLVEKIFHQISLYSGKSKNCEELANSGNAHNH
jgi:aminoglycoside N3'-acetyltransferase